MMIQNWTNKIYYLIFIALLMSCSTISSQPDLIKTIQPANILDYSASPSSPQDRSSLAFSDQGAWFAYGFTTEVENYGGFAGPFLMTQENGVWCSRILSQLILIDDNTKERINWQNFIVTQKSYLSHLEQVYENDRLKISQTLFYYSAHTAIITARICNISGKPLILHPEWHGKSFLKSLTFKKQGDTITIDTEKSPALGYINIIGDHIKSIELSDSAYTINVTTLELDPGETGQLLIEQSFIFPEYDRIYALQQNRTFFTHNQDQLKKRILEKENQIQILFNKLTTNGHHSAYKNLIAKTVLTLQNNWRIPAGELEHSGLFPSYHYIWFHGFWAWDSWKHAVALAQYDVDLAKEQIRAMYDFQDENGFIADCVYRDTSIENHNYRNTKPPLSAWAIWKVYEQDNDLDFLEELYPKVVRQHNWWYNNRDHDKDGICEYGSSDGSLIAAKWESGMDNAVRFDESNILKNSESAFSLNQESVDLNSYLYAEKKYLSEMAKSLQKNDDANVLKKESIILKTKIQKQFYDLESGWFYDTSIDGSTFIKVMGCEGWIPLWAEVANQEQAKFVKNNMMDLTLFNTRVPFQTLSANHPKFKPDGGYWRGPTWLDQAYFGVKGLGNYGYAREASEATYKLIHNAEGILSKGKSIRENYHPLTGDGLESENFSWSAAHYLLLLINE